MVEAFSTFFLFLTFELVFVFFSFFTGKVCHEGNRNSRHPAITSNIISLCSLYLKTSECKAAAKPASEQIHTPSQAAMHCVVPPLVFFGHRG